MADPYAFLKQRNTSPTQGIENLMMAFMSGPSPLDRQKFELDRQNTESNMEYRRALMGQAQAQADVARQKLNAPQSIADAMAKMIQQGNSPVPPTGAPPGPVMPGNPANVAQAFQQNFPAILQASAAGGFQHQIGDIMRPYLASLGDDNMVRMAQNMAGTPMSETQEKAIAFRDLDPALQATAVGPTRTQFEGSTLADLFSQDGALSREEKMAALKAEPAQVTPRNILGADGKPLGISYDGGRTVNGQPVPPGAVVANATVQDTAEGFKGIGTAPANKVQTQLIGLQKAASTVNRYRDLLGNMSGDDFGVLGKLKGMGQDAIDQFEGVASLALSKGFEDEETAQQITELTNRMFNDALPAREVLRSMLIADLAARFSGDGRIAAHHLDRAAAIVGTDWSGKRTIDSKLDEIQRSMEAEYQAYMRLADEGMGGLPANLFDQAPAPPSEGGITGTIRGAVDNLTRVPQPTAPAGGKTRIRFDSQGNMIE